MDLFWLVSRLMNNIKSHMIYAYLDDALVLEIYHIFGVIYIALDADLKYLRLMIQPNCYGIQDWN